MNQLVTLGSSGTSYSDIEINMTHDGMQIYTENLKQTTFFKSAITVLITTYANLSHKQTGPIHVRENEIG